MDAKGFENKLDKVVGSTAVVFVKLSVIEFLLNEVTELNGPKAMMTKPMFMHPKLLLSAQGVGVESADHVCEWLELGPDVRAGVAAPSVSSTHSNAVLEEHGVALVFVKSHRR